MNGWVFAAITLVVEVAAASFFPRLLVFFYFPLFGLFVFAGFPAIGFFVVRAWSRGGKSGIHRRYLESEAQRPPLGRLGE
jgi:hypothetical protein